VSFLSRVGSPGLQSIQIKVNLVFYSFFVENSFFLPKD
jgi:hypothetical protein